MEIGKAGWEIVRSPKVRFWRPRGLLRLPPPVLVWLLGAFQFGGPFFVLVLQGEQGSAKSTAAQVLRRLVGPNRSPLRGTRKHRDLMVAAEWMKKHEYDPEHGKNEPVNTLLPLALLERQRPPVNLPNLIKFRAAQ